MRCEACQASLESVAPTRVLWRQEIGIPGPHVLVKICCCCGHQSTAAFPPHVRAAVQYGPYVRTLAVYFSTVQFIPEDRLQGLFEDVFQGAVCPATGPGTGNYRIGKRGSVQEELAGGVVVHDHFKSCAKRQQAVRHAFCNAHHLRELRGIDKRYGEKWARLLLPSRGRARYRPVLLVELYGRIPEKALQLHEALGPPDPGRRCKRPGHNLALRLSRGREETLRFLHEPGMPFTNKEGGGAGPAHDEGQAEDFGLFPETEGGGDFLRHWGVGIDADETGAEGI